MTEVIIIEGTFYCELCVVTQFECNDNLQLNQGQLKGMLLIRICRSFSLVFIAQLLSRAFHKADISSTLIMYYHTYL